MSRISRAAKLLLDDLVSATKAATGYPEEHVRQFVEPATKYLLREYGGDRLPKLEHRRGHPIEDILDALSRGVAIPDVCKRYAISRATLYRLLAEAKKSEKPQNDTGCLNFRNY